MSPPVWCWQDSQGDVADTALLLPGLRVLQAGKSSVLLAGGGSTGLLLGSLSGSALSWLAPGL